MLVLDMQAMKKYLDHGFRIAKPLVTPLFNYALGWFSPELFGTGFLVNSIGDHHISGTIPHSKFNSNAQGEIHPGLVINSGFELIRQLLARHLGIESFRVEDFETRLKKNHDWNVAIFLKLEVNEVALDRFFIDLQKNAMAQIDLEIEINRKIKKVPRKDLVKSKDIIKFSVGVRSQKLLV